jgi:hypothetical protein
MAEREGFEPSVEVSPYTRLAGEHLKPTRSSLRIGFTEEGFRAGGTVRMRPFLGLGCCWRRERDSNPRSPEGKRFSRPPP